MSVIDWGDAPTWVGSVFAGLGTAAAGAAAWFAFQTIKSQREQIGEQRQFIAEQSATMSLERQELRAAAEERRVSQARQVVMHDEWDGTETAIGPDGEEITLADYWVVTVSNFSGEPIRDLVVKFGSVEEPVVAFRIDESGRETRLPVPVPLLGPGRKCRLESREFLAADLSRHPPSLLFMDASGQRWRLDDHGELTEVAGDEA